MLNYTLIDYILRLKKSGRLLQLAVNKRFILSLLVTSLLLDPTHNAIAQTADELKKLDSTLKQSEISLKQAKNKRKATLAKLESIEKQIAERTLRFDLTQAKVAKLDKQAQTQSDQRNALQRTYDQQQARLAQLVESAYLMGQQSGLKVALSQQGTQHLARLNHYAKAIADARQTQLDSLISLQQELNIENDELDKQRRQLDGLTKLLEEDQRYLKQLKTNRLAMIKTLDNKIDADTQTVDQLRQRKAELEKVLAQISKRQKARAASKLARQKRYQKNKKTAAQKPAAQEKIISRGGTLPLPAKANIVVQFGQKRAKSGLPWSGILMEGREGSEIHAISAGEVVYADWLQGYGQMVIIDHGSGVMSLYGHNKRIHKAVGDKVQQSDIIATMGDTAGLQKAALYFEIRQNGVAQDPLKWCRI